MQAAELDIAALQRGLRIGALTSVGLVRHCLDRIAAIDSAGPELRAVLSLNPDALEIAAGLDHERRAGSLRGPLHGIPVLVKDNIDTGDRQPTTAGSLVFSDRPALRDAEVVRRLREAGAVVPPMNSRGAVRTGSRAKSWRFSSATTGPACCATSSARR